MICEDVFHPRIYLATLQLLEIRDFDRVKQKQSNCLVGIMVPIQTKQHGPDYCFRKLLETFNTAGTYIYCLTAVYRC